MVELLFGDGLKHFGLVLFHKELFDFFGVDDEPFLQSGVGDGACVFYAEFEGAVSVVEELS